MLLQHCGKGILTDERCSPAWHQGLLQNPWECSSQTWLGSSLASQSLSICRNQHSAAQGQSVPAAHLWPHLCHSSGGGLQVPLPGSATPCLNPLVSAHREQRCHQLCCF